MGNDVILDTTVIGDLQEMLGDDIAELFAEYLIDTASLLEQMEQAAAQNDIPALTSLAHSLKGSSGNLGVASLYGLNLELEVRGRAAAVTDAVSEVRKIREAFNAAQGTLRQLAGHA